MNLFDGTDLLETTSTEVKNRILKPGQMLRAIDTGALYYCDKDGKPTAATRRAILHIAALQGKAMP